VIKQKLYDIIMSSRTKKKRSLYYYTYRLMKMKYDRNIKQSVGFGELTNACTNRYRLTAISFLSPVKS
jgi:hypothetical protein